MNIKRKGTLFVMVATFIFGVTPIIGRITYDMGSNGIQLAFFRNIFVLPLFLLILLIKKVSFKVNKQQVLDIIKVGFVGNALTLLFLYTSYSYIGVGTATVLHFLYPIFVVMINLFVYHQKLNKKQLICLILAIVGILCFIEKSSSSMIGFVLALVSGIFFAYYMIGMDHSSVKEVDTYLFNFYLVFMNSFVIGIMGYLMGMLSILPLMGYVYSLIVAIFASLVGVVLLQKGICYLGSTQAAILSTLEPITSVVIGIVLLNESLTMMKLIGCILILVSTVVLVKSQSDKKEYEEVIVYEKCS